MTHYVGFGPIRRLVASKRVDAQRIRFLELLNGSIQYVVPRWQRRYCWGEADIERLVEDVLTVAVADPDATHYGGTLLTFQEPGAAGVVSTHRVVDGQQRLTTVSILLSCIAAELGPNEQRAGWSAEDIDLRLKNPVKSQQKYRKLRLQDGDEDEYRSILEGSPSGAGAVTQAWRTARRLVAHNSLEQMLTGLERLRVVSIGLGDKDDPQQIFESLNATGRPLTESEKVKNWLLMGLPDEQQQELHEGPWREIERSLGAEHTTVPIDIFLRDVLRWRTGELHGIDRVYSGLRRWAVQQGSAKDRPALCRDLARLAGLYGILTGTAGPHKQKDVERGLQHLRAMEIHIHRPLTLRLLDDTSNSAKVETTDKKLAEVLAGVGTWITRLWLADRPTAGLNKAVAELAHGLGPRPEEDFAEHWLERIRKLRNSRIGVPNDEAVREGVRTRKAYGGGVTKTSFAVFCALMEDEHKESPAREKLTIEHVMPQKLTDQWKRDLGEGAEEIHDQYVHKLANLTLSGYNPEMGTARFRRKREVYKKSAIGMTQRLAEEDEWNEDALERRAEDLAARVLRRWPWTDQGVEQPGGPAGQSTLQWRIDDGPWHSEQAASQMVLNVVGELLSRDPENAQRLSGDSLNKNLQSASQYPPGTAVGGGLMRAIPGHDQYVLYPYERDYPTSVDRCRNMGKRCSALIEVELQQSGLTPAFWTCLRVEVGGVPGQKKRWRGPTQWTSALNSKGDAIGIYVGSSDQLWLYIRAGQSQPAKDRAVRMRMYSRRIREQMSDQVLARRLESESRKGRTVAVKRLWTREDEDEWPEAARWIVEQCERLQSIMAEPLDPTAM